MIRLGLTDVRSRSTQARLKLDTYILGSVVYLAYQGLEGFAESEGAGAYCVKEGEMEQVRRRQALTRPLSTEGQMRKQGDREDQACGEVNQT